MCTLFYFIPITLYISIFLRTFFIGPWYTNECGAIEKKSNKAFKFYVKVFQFYLFFFVSSIVFSLSLSQNTIFFHLNSFLQEKWKTGNNWMGQQKNPNLDKNMLNNALYFENYAKIVKTLMTSIPKVLKVSNCYRIQNCVSMHRKRLETVQRRIWMWKNQYVTIKPSLVFLKSWVNRLCFCDNLELLWLRYWKAKKWISTSEWWSSRFCWLFHLKYHDKRVHLKVLLLSDSRISIRNTHKKMLRLTMK